MGNQEQQNQMDKDTLELVLQEFIEEQKAINQNINNLIQTTNQLQEKFKEFEVKISKPNPVNVNTNTKLFLQFLQKGMLDIKLMIGNQPKSIQWKFTKYANGFVLLKKRFMVLRIGFFGSFFFPRHSMKNFASLRYFFS